MNWSSMTFATYNISDSDRQTIVEEANNYTFRMLIPTITFYSLLAVLGTTGNIFAIYIFAARMRSNFQNDLFTLLSVVNFLACGISLPLDIMDVITMYTYPSVGLCKASRFLNMFTMMVSTITLTAMAIFRLKSAHAGTVVNPKKCVRATGILSLLLASSSVSWIAPRVFGIRSIPTFVDDVMGQDCSVADDTEHTAWPMVFNLVLCFGFGTLIIVIIIAYYKIWRIVKTSRLTVTSHGKLVSTLSQTKLKASSVIGHNKTTTRKTANYKTRKTQPRPNKSNRPIRDFKNVDIVDKVEDIANVVLNERNVEKNDVNEKKRNVEQLPDFEIETNFGVESLSYKCGESGSISEAISVVSNWGSINSTNINIKPILESFTELSLIRPKEAPHCGSDRDIWRSVDNLGMTYLVNDLHDLSMATRRISGNYANDHSRRFVSTSGLDNRVEQLCSKISINQSVASKISHNSIKKLSDKSTDAASKLNSTPKVPPRRSLEAAITRTAFLLTVTFLISYVPFLLVSIPRMLDKDIDYSMDAVKMNLINVSVRLYFVMPSVSPLILWASNLDFRRKFRAVWTRDI